MYCSMVSLMIAGMYKIPIGFSSALENCYKKLCEMGDHGFLLTTTNSKAN